MITERINSYLKKQISLSQVQAFYEQQNLADDKQARNILVASVGQAVLDGRLCGKKKITYMAHGEYQNSRFFETVNKYISD